MKEVREVKNLNTRLKLAETDLEEYKQKVTRANLNLSNKRVEIANLKTQITSLTKVDKKLKVSEHALLRYIERVLDINIEALENLVLNEETKALVSEFQGNGKFPLGDRQIVVKDYTITTII